VLFEEVDDAWRLQSKLGLQLVQEPQIIHFLCEELVVGRPGILRFDCLVDIKVPQREHFNQKVIPWIIKYFLLWCPLLSLIPSSE
jgi:hypothetical protein